MLFAIRSSVKEVINKVGDEGSQSLMYNDGG